MSKKKIVLLTGAGFTKNFGGFLAEEVWEYLINSAIAQENKELKQYILSDFNYEALYQQLFGPTGDKKNDAKLQKDFLQALKKVYLELDDNIRCHDTDLNLSTFKNFIEALWSNNQGSQKVIFTLNQDLFLERLFTDEIYYPLIGNQIKINLSLLQEQIKNRLLKKVL